MRPKGMGLGADRTMVEKDLHGKKFKRKPGDTRGTQQEEDSLKKGSYVVILKGPHQDLYGKVHAVQSV